MQGLMMDYPLTLDRIVEHAGRLFPRNRIRSKLPDGGMHEYTYADLLCRSRRLAAALVGLGVEPGDRVGTFAWNHYQHLEMYFGIPGAGAVCHTLNIRLFPNQLAYIVNHAEDRVVFIDGSVLPLYEKVAGEVDCVEHYVLVNATRDIETRLPNVLHYEDLIDGVDDDFDWRSTDEQMAMGLCYTSGTTGDPKGALYSHRSMFLHTLGENQGTALGLTEADVVLAVVPQFHAMSWGLPFACTLAGAELIMPGPHLQPAPLAELIESYRVTVAAGVPSIWNGLYHELKTTPRDISCVRELVVGGSAMPRSLIEGYERDLGVNVLHAWGMTELSPLGTLSKLRREHQDLPAAEQWDVKARQGYPLGGVELRIVGEDGTVLPWDGETMGELQARGPWVIRSYFKRDPTPEHFTADGWFRTGDVATISPDGYMTITDRTKDLVKSGGEWISTVALESALMAHEQVLEAAVIAVPDEKWTERPLAVVVRTPEGDVSAEDLRTCLAVSFAKFEIPDQFVFVDELPKTSVGKFDKKVLRSCHAEGAL
ncbi:MAG TPA: long-chain fatty acid--CoA ligase [Vicinamibacterales bacterium]|jgi:fatty-acyl-CoA synthase|nr:long-chain fatty acid--CoA ligase [Vicinamibacterales bacterium]